MGPSALFALFGIENNGLALAVNLVLLLIGALWIALIYWTYADARRRIEDDLLVACATLASLFPFVGTIIYMIVRPPEYLVDSHDRDLEVAAAEARMAQLEALACPYCDFEIEKSFLRCPSCLRRLKEPCRTCGKPLDPRWKICPYCESEVAQSTPRRRASRPSGRAAGAASPPTRAQASAPDGEGSGSRGRSGPATATGARPPRNAPPDPDGGTRSRPRPPAR